MEAIETADVLLENRVSDQKPMRTTIDTDDALMRKAMRLSGLTTKKAVVEAALRLLVQTHFQTVSGGFEAKYDGKAISTCLVADTCLGRNTTVIIDKSSGSNTCTLR
jgi:Arc/MetJ family transcription regulator